MPCCFMKRRRWLRSTDSGVGRQTISVAEAKELVILEDFLGEPRKSLLPTEDSDLAKLLWVFGVFSSICATRAFGDRSNPKKDLPLVEPVAEVPHHEQNGSCLKDRSENSSNFKPAGKDVDSPVEPAIENH